MYGRISLLYLGIFCLHSLAQAAEKVIEVQVVPVAQGVKIVYEGEKTAEKNGAWVTATFSDGTQSDGWGKLWLKTTNASVDDNKKMYAVGYAEGFLTAEHIYNHFMNNYEATYGVNKTQPPEVLAWFREQNQWARRLASKYAAQDKFWGVVNSLYAQFDGLMAGYKAANLPGKELTEDDLYFVQSIGDTMDLHVSTTDPDNRPDWLGMSTQELSLYIAQTTHCSALVRATADLSDLFVAHSSWNTYSSMIRIFKHYHFDTLANPDLATHCMSFSSYPGLLSSLDDFFMMDSGLAVTETTNNVFQSELYDEVHPESLLTWQRVRAANALARTGKEWASLVARYNSGTYNNQYMVVDYKGFHRGVEIKDGTLWVIEQIPGHVESRDMTDELRNGHWPSYNVPFFEKIYHKSGYPAIVEKHGVGFSYQMAPRATIFRRDAEKVETIEDMQRIMRYNRYKTDSLSKGDPSASICSRYDLSTGMPIAVGCYDSKITNYDMFTRLAAIAVNGPTTGDDGSIPPFSWKNPAFAKAPHRGMPDLYDFTFVPMESTPPVILP
eukprot:comp20950_c0_seq1/m.28009 comp20950_c0_seq1/g.28009  ORF comp20950_c0_seq1/g.28009 comp20950_c0_seq1/m.28009 type:complete len:553 (-) comp20950_c0_seq1:50-1708(-)